MTLAATILLLAAVLGFAVVQPRRLPEAVAAVPAAALVVATGLLPWHDAVDRVRELGDTIGFLAAVLVIAARCDAEGVFAAAGRLTARGSRGRPVRLLVLVFGVAAAVTAVLSLDATVVLLTPVVLTTARRLRVDPRPSVYSCAHLSNSASLLLPVSNLTNLLAYGATGLSFGGFAARMALPWVVAVGVEYGIFRLFFASALRAPPAAPEPVPAGDVPWFALGVVAATLVAFALTSLAGIAPVWAATAGAAVLGVKALVTRTVTPVRILRAADVPFLLFVPALAIVVAAVADHGLGDAVERLLPDTPTLAGLLGTAAVAALLSNLLNNLPAVLILLPAVGPRPALVLAVLLGVNIGPNLTYVGSLATLLWRRVLRERDAAPSLSTSLWLGALATPPTLVAAVLALWLSLRLLG